MLHVANSGIPILLEVTHVRLISCNNLNFPSALGAANSIELSEALPGLVGDDGKGLTATFTRGTEDRQMVINFLCDKNSEVDVSVT